MNKKIINTEDFDFIAFDQDYEKIKQEVYEKTWLKNSVKTNYNLQHNINNNSTELNNQSILNKYFNMNYEKSNADMAKKQTNNLFLKLGFVAFAAFTILLLTSILLNNPNILNKKNLVSNNSSQTTTSVADFKNKVFSVYAAERIPENQMVYYETKFFIESQMMPKAEPMITKIWATNTDFSAMEYNSTIVDTNGVKKTENVESVYIKEGDFVKDYSNFNYKDPKNFPEGMPEYKDTRTIICTPDQLSKQSEEEYYKLEMLKVKNKAWEKLVQDMALGGFHLSDPNYERGLQMQKLIIERLLEKEDKIKMEKDGENTKLLIKESIPDEITKEDGTITKQNVNYEVELVFDKNYMIKKVDGNFDDTTSEPGKVNKIRFYNEVIKAEKIKYDPNFFIEKANKLELVDTYNLNGGCLKNGKTVDAELDKLVIGQQKNLDKALIDASYRVAGKTEEESRKVQAEINQVIEKTNNEFEKNLQSFVDRGVITADDARQIKNNYIGTAEYFDGAFVLSFPQPELTEEEKKQQEEWLKNNSEMQNTSTSSVSQ